MKQYKCAVHYRTDENEIHFMENTIVFAGSEKQAREAAYDKVWDCRLEAAGCNSYIIVEEIEDEEEIKA